MKRMFRTAFAIATIVMLAAPAGAIAADASSLHFTTTMISHLGDQAQRTGDLVITIAADGGVSGTYRGIAGGPDAGKSMPVTGGEQGSTIHLTLGKNADYTIVGSIDDGGIIGTAYDAGRTQYDFVASNA